MKSSNNVLALLVVVFVAIIGVAVMLFVPSIVNNFSDFSDNVGFAANIYQNFSPTINTFSSTNLVTYSTADNTKTITFSINDDAVYKTAYISINGTTWQPIILTGTTLNGNWLQQSSTGTYNIQRAKIPNAIGSDNYIIIYTCTKNTTGSTTKWNCHNNKWQIRPFNTTKTTASFTHPYIETVTANNYDTASNTLPEMSIDNNLADVNRWSGEGDGAWIKYTFKNTIPITGINILFYKSSMRVARFTLEYSLDDNTWTKIGDYSSSGTTTTFEAFKFNKITTKYFRIVGHGNTEQEMENWTSIIEVQFTNSTTPACISHSYSACYSGNVYWYNSCNTREGIKTSCTASQTCPNTVCVNNPSANPIKIFIIGDSTAAEYSTADWYPLTGWGMEMQQFFDDQRVIIVNNAESGASSKSYLTSPKWTDTQDSMSAGDYLFIQFGHNDEHTEDPSRYTEPYSSYKNYLQMYIDAARDKGVNPVLLTPVERNYWDGSDLIYSHTDPLTNTDYPPAMMELAQEQNVPLIDITEKTRALYLDLGQDTVTYDLFINIAPGDYPNYPDGREDNSHYQVRGAYEAAKLVVEGIQELGSDTDLTPYILGTDTIPTTGNIYYVSPSGNDGNLGTIGSPWFTLERAWETVSAGDTIYLRGGNYRYTDTNYMEDKSGSAGNMINVWNYPGEKPILNYSGVIFPSQTQCFGMRLHNINYVHFKGIRITSIAQINEYDAQPNYGIILYDDVSNCIFEQMETDHIGGWGVTIADRCYNNLFLNCDSHHNADPYSPDTYGGSDGFQTSSASSTGITFRGCRSWANSDDGWDLRLTQGDYTFDNCRSFWNGYIPSTVGTTWVHGGNGEAMKVGGDGGFRLIKNTLMFENYLGGIQNSDNGKGYVTMEVYNSIAYKSIMGFNFEYGHPTILRNNIAYKNTYDWLNGANTVQDHNSWNLFTVTDSDFLSLDSSCMDDPRDEYGTLPDCDFLKPSSHSKLIGNGTDVGLDTDGAGKPWKNTPSIGAYEYYP